MRLRAHCSNNEYFREVADFVAHNEERNKGVALKSLEALYLSFKYFMEYVSPKKALDISLPFPMYVKRLMKFQIEKCNEADLRKKFNVTKQRLTARLDTLFKDDKPSGATVLKGRIGAETLAALQHITSFIGVNSAFTQDDLLSQTLAVLSENKLNYDEATIRGNFDKVCLCVLVLLHNTTFNIGAHRSAHCEASCEKQSAVKNFRAIDDQNKIVVINEDFGCLDVKGYIPTLNNGKDLVMCYSLFITNLRVDDWCESDLISEQVENGTLYKKVNLAGELSVSRNFKLTLRA
jgi:hypothetical protein